MKIYHYTSIDTLEKILSNRTIRFNNLNNVDDLEERFYSPYSKYVFVSCWTDSPVESIPCGGCTQVILGREAEYLWTLICLKDTDL